MRKSIRIRLFLALLLLALTASRSIAKDTSSVDRDLAQCRALAGKKKWKEAVKAYRRIFTDHERDPEVIRRLKEIEDGLRRCLFRTHYKLPSGRKLFGNGVESFSHTTRKLEGYWILHKPVLPWKIIDKTTAILDIRFEPQVEMEMEGLDLFTWDRYKDEIGHIRFMGVLVSYDPEKEGGYAIFSSIGKQYRAPKLSFYTEALRLSSEGVKQIHTGYKGIPGIPKKVSVKRSARMIKVAADGRTVASIKDSTYRSGCLGFTGGVPAAVRVTGKVDATWHRQLLTAYEGAAFEKWQEDWYDRTRVIPEWARSGAASATESAPIRLPNDAPDGRRAEVGALVTGVLEGELKALASLATLLPDLPEKTRIFSQAALFIALGHTKQALVQIGDLLRKQADFGPGLALRGLLRLRLREMGLARTDLEKARDLSPTCAWAYIGLANAAIYEGDLPLAEKILMAGEKAGAKSKPISQLRDIVHRSRQGPLWSTTYTHSTGHFDIASDHSRELCKEVGGLLERALTAYSKRFPDATIPKRKGRVYVFGDRAGYLRYARDRHMDMAFSAGAYNPSLRELVLFLPMHRRGFEHTIRHEGFHRFLHEFVDSAPIWFDEGCAEYFAASRKGFGGGLVSGELNQTALDTLREHRGKLTSLKELVLLSPADFMRNASVHYAQSWVLIHFLMQTDDERLKGLVREIFRRLRQGASASELTEDLLREKLRILGWAYLEHLDALLR